MEGAGHWGALALPLGWSLPPVRFVTTKEWRTRPTEVGRREMAQGMQNAASESL